jgi:hypothetical protein
MSVMLELALLVLALPVLLCSAYLLLLTLLVRTRREGAEP